MSIHKTFPHIQTERLLLKLPDLSDAPKISGFLLENKDNLKPWEPEADTAYFTEQYWQERTRQLRHDFIHDKSCCMSIFLVNTGQLIGMVNYSNFIRGAFHSCFLGFKMAENMQGQSYMTEAVKSSIPYIFEELNLHRISANYMPENHKSARVLEKCGFKQEGIAEDYLLINGKWQTHILTSLINKNWKKRD